MEYIMNQVKKSNGVNQTHLISTSWIIWFTRPNNDEVSLNHNMSNS